MKRFFPSLCLALLTVLAHPATPAQAQSGILLKTFPLQTGKLLLDPVRPQLYATLPASNSLAVINTDTNTLVTTFFIGSNPVDLAISPDGTRLYILNGGSTAAGIGVVDLTSLTTLASLPTPFQGTAIAAGLNNELYVLSSAGDEGGTTGLVHINATTGVSEGMFPGDAANYTGFLQISPDYKTLFYGNAGLSPSTLASFDVSTTTPTLLQETPFDTVGENGEGLTISHNGLYLVYPNGAGNGSGGYYSTSLIPTSNLDSVLGTFANGAYPGLAVFSADDTLLYQEQVDGGDNGQSAITVFSTKTFTQLDSFVDPDPNSTNGYGSNITSLAITAPNGYLYVSRAGDISGSAPGNLEIISTQTAPFFNGSTALSDGFFYLQFPDGNLFGYYNFNFTPFLYHNDLGFEYPIDAADGSGGVYLYDFTSETFFYTSPTLFPYLYNFSLDSFLYYYPSTTNPGHYTAFPRYFYNFTAGKIITL